MPRSKKSSEPVSWTARMFNKKLYSLPVPVLRSLYARYFQNRLPSYGNYKQMPRESRAEFESEVTTKLTNTTQ